MTIGIRQAALEAGVSPSTIRRAIALGELGHTRRGARVLIFPEDLHAWLMRGYVCGREGSQRGEHLPSAQRPASGRDRDDADRPTADAGVSSPAPSKRPRLPRVEGQPRRAVAAPRSTGAGRRAHLDAWQVPPKVA